MGMCPIKVWGIFHDLSTYVNFFLTIFQITVVVKLMLNNLCPGVMGNGSYAKVGAKQKLLRSLGNG
jgi:hypothetical protein